MMRRIFGGFASLLAISLAGCGGETPQGGTGATGTGSSTETHTSGGTGATGGGGTATGGSGTTTTGSGGATTSTGTGGGAVGGGGAAAIVFVEEDSTTAVELYDAWSFGDGDAYAVGAQGTVLKRHNGVWAGEASGTGELLDAIWAGSPASVYVGGGDTNGIVLHSSGDGTWTPEPLPASTGRIVSLWGTAGDDVYASTSDAVIHRDAGGTWAELPNTPFGYHLWVAAPDDVYLTGFGVVHHLSGGIWTDEPTPGELQMDVCGSSGGAEVLIVAEHGVTAQKIGGVWNIGPQVVPEPVHCRQAQPGAAFVFGNNEAAAPVKEGRIGHIGATVASYTVPRTLWGGAVSAADVIAVGGQGAIYRAALP